MEAAEYAKMARIQDEHWWFAVKRQLAQVILMRHGAAGGRRRVLEIGCGTGAMISTLGAYGRVVGMDLYAPALEHVRGADRLVGDALSLPVADGAVDLVACFDLLYHRNVPQVDRAVAEIARVLAPAGHVLITDSASPALYGRHDAAHHGARRFHKGDLQRQLVDAGLSIVHASYFHTAVFPLVAISRIGGRWLRQLAGTGELSTRGHSQLRPTPGWLSAMIGALYRIEIPLAARIGLPFGVSVVVLARGADAETASGPRDAS